MRVLQMSSSGKVRSKMRRQMHEYCLIDVGCLPHCYNFQIDFLRKSDWHLYLLIQPRNLPCVSFAHVPNAAVQKYFVHIANKYLIRLPFRTKLIFFHSQKFSLKTVHIIAENTDILLQENKLCFVLFIPFYIS